MTGQRKLMLADNKIALNAGWDTEILAIELQALTRVTAFEIDQKSFAQLIADRPAIAEEVTAILSAGSDDVGQFPPAAMKHERSASAFLKSIRTIFST